ncbi:MAG: hypothetical protein ACYDDF_03620 [Thermoplasmatota archaeon]
MSALVLGLFLAPWTSLASANTQTLNLSGTVADVAPALASASISPPSPGPTAGTTTTVTLSITVTDQNGYQDVTTSPAVVKVTVNKPDKSSELAATAMTCSGGSGQTITCSYNLAMNYYDPSGTYEAYFNATDASGGAATLVSYAFTYAASKLIGSLSPTTATFASTAPGSTSSAVTITVYNGGNTASSVCPSMSSDLAGGVSAGSSIPKGDVQASAASGMTSPLAMTTTTTNPVSGVSVPGTINANVATYWTLTVPMGTSAGAYTGTVSIASC